MPSRWNQGARWYRRASRERSGAVVAAVLDDLRTLGSPEALRRRYVEQDGEWARALADQRGLGDASGADLRRIEDAAYGLRWLEVTRGIHVDLRQSLVPQLPLGVLNAESSNERPERVRPASAPTDGSDTNVDTWRWHKETRPRRQQRRC